MLNRAFRHHRHAGVTPCRQQLSRRLHHSTLPAAIGGSNGTRAHAAKQPENNTDPVQCFQDLFQQDDDPVVPNAASGKHYHQQQQRERQQKANAPTEAPTMVHMCIVHAVHFGQKMRLVGSPPALGAWDAQQGPDMSWHEGHKWSVDVGLAVGNYEFKYVLVHDSGHIEWESGSNRVVEVPASAAEMQVRGQWNQTQDTEVLEVREKPSWTQRRKKQQQQLALLQEAADAAVDADNAKAAAEAADLLQVLLQQQKELLQQQLKQQREAKQAASSIESAQDSGVLAEEPAAVTADADSFPLAASSSSSSSVAPPAFSAAQDKLISMLHEMKLELSSSIAGVAAAVEEVQGEVGNVQQQVAQLTAERILQQQQGQQEGLAAGLLQAGMHGLTAELQAQQHQAGADGPTDHDSSSSSSLPVGWGAAAAAGGAAAEAVPASAPAGDLSLTSAATLSGLQTAVLGWRQEVLTFRQESMLMRTELHGLKDGMEDIEQQLQANTAAIKELQQVVMEQEAYDRARAARYRGSSRAAASGAAAAGESSSGSGRSAENADAQHHMAAGTDADGSLEDLLVSQFHQLAADLSAEVKQAVQEAAAAQQHQASPLEDLMSQVWMKPPEQLLEQLMRQQKKGQRDQQ